MPAKAEPVTEHVTCALQNTGSHHSGAVSWVLPEAAHISDQAVALIDRGLGDIAERSIVSTAEIADLLLDVRTLLTRVDVLSIQN